MNRLLPGEMATLQVKSEVPYGYFLTNGYEDVLLHESEIKSKVKVGDQVEVFLHHDSEDRLCATMKTPKITTETYDWVEVVHAVPNLGVFLDIGLSKDLLLSVDDLPAIPSLWPEKGDQLYCSLKVDKRGRLLAKLATEDIIMGMAVEAPKSSFNQNIRGRVYRLLKVGSFILSDVGYRGFIHESERKREPRLGEIVEGRIIGVKEDGSVNVSLLPRKHEAIDKDADRIYQFMLSRNGAMPYSDKSDPYDIQTRFNMSKAAFKRALGRLMKEKKIYQEDGWTYINNQKERS
ncbi:S1 RNA-binding domain-containing protein [Bacillus kexueae]|uniref:CvfB family protein n=1 Tax=Aeribacillus kexueae TaxID=2078952 RepID=UPI001FAFB074|nr:S1 RNA-binding domain-containing protein [Bacillus kexueae]